MSHNIIILGPSLDAKGGIVSVVKSLSYSYDPFVYVETTSSKSFIVNLITLVRVQTKSWKQSPEHLPT